MKLIVGLGNPGPEYQTTRHNAGWWVIDKFGTKFGAHYVHKKSLYCDLAKVNIEGNDVLLAKPTTYMNDSGSCLVAVCNWYKLEHKDLLVVHDDVSLPLGRIRFQTNGGAGGQHGVESIIQSFGGNKDFHRLKFGIGPDPGGQLRAAYVLDSIPEPDRILANSSIDLSVQALFVWLAQGIDIAMNQFNGINP